MKSAFPKKDMFGKMRSFQTAWYKEFPFIEYSKNNDAVYCFCCRHFPAMSGKHEDAFTSGFSNWHKAVEKLRKHSESASHKNSMELWANYMQTRVSGTVLESITTQSVIQTKENREYIESLLKVAILCAKQEIALRGHREGPESPNKGNFLEIFDLLKSENDWLDKRAASAAKNAKYTSPDIQNSLLQATCRAVLEGIKEEVHLAKYFVIMVDESRDISKIEQVSLCVRYCLDSKVYERFLGFYDTQKVDAENLTSLIIQALLDHGLNIHDCIAQYYDGASVMSGEHSGVQRRIQNIVEHCIYVHCHAHRLNLVLVSTARHIRSCEDFFGVLQLLHSFFSVSAKRHSTFVQVQKDHQLPSMEIPGLSDTRWACRFQSVRVVKERIECIIETLKYICDNSTDGQEGAEATGILTQMTTWCFVFHLILFFKLLGITNGLSQMLQSEALDLAGAICLVCATLKTLSDYRKQDKYLHIYDNTREIANSLNIPLLESQRRSHRTRTSSTRLKDMIVL